MSTKTSASITFILLLTPYRGSYLSTIKKEGLYSWIAAQVILDYHSFHVSHVRYNSCSHQ